MSPYEEFKKKYPPVEDMPPVLKMMALWADAMHEYAHLLTLGQLKAAHRWFDSYVNSEAITPLILKQYDQFHENPKDDK